MKLKGFLRKKMEKPEIDYPMLFIREPKQFVVLPSLKDLSKVDVKYPLLEPLVYAKIKWSNERKKIIYNVLEPKLDAKEKEMFIKVKEAITEVIDVKLSVMKNRKEAIVYLENKVKKLTNDLRLKIPPETYIKLLYYIVRDFVGINEIEPLMYDPYIEDIGCTGLDNPVYIIHRRFGSIETNIVFNDIEYLGEYIIKLSEKCGRYISYATPLLDGTLPDGSRVQASLAKDVTTKGPTFSIRKFRRNPFSPVDMITLKTASLPMLSYLWFLLEHGASILVCGGVSTGKTTFLNALSMFIKPEDKIVSIEDTREINLSHKNWIPSVSRTGFGIPDSRGEKYGEVKLFDLLKESFRMNPDYVIVGEIRGKEAYVMFQGMSSGHPTLGTMHAGSVDDVIKRLETPPIELSPSLIESLDVLVIMTGSGEKGKSARKVKELVEIQSIDKHTGDAHTVPIFRWTPSTDEFKDNTSNSEILRKMSFQTGMSYKKILEEIDNRQRVLGWMVKHDVIQFDDVAKIVNLYYKDQKTVMNWVNRNTPPSKTSLKTKIKKKWEPVTDIPVMQD